MMRFVCCFVVCLFVLTKLLCSKPFRHPFVHTFWSLITSKLRFLLSIFPYPLISNFKEIFFVSDQNRTSLTRSSSSSIEGQDTQSVVFCFVLFFVFVFFNEFILVEARSEENIQVWSKITMEAESNPGPTLRETQVNSDHDHKPVSHFAFSFLFIFIFPSWIDWLTIKVLYRSSVRSLF